MPYWRWVPRRIFQVLLVEDNPGDVGLFKEACREIKAPGRLHVAENGLVALRFLHKQKEYVSAPTPDVVILDLNLPGVGGREVLETMKADPMLRTIPVIVFTSSNSRSEMLECYDQGAACFITKPTNIEEYFSAVRASERFWLLTASLPNLKRLQPGQSPLGPDVPPAASAASSHT